MLVFIQQENGSISQAHAHQVKISVDPHSKPPDTKVPEKQQNTGSWFKNIIVQAGKQALSSIDRLLFRFWVGPPLEKAEWTKTHPKNNLLDQFGPMFEDCRGVRMVMTRYKLILICCSNASTHSLNEVFGVLYSAGRHCGLVVSEFCWNT